MPLQNRVLATGDFIATPARGLFMGNRGILHDERRQLGRARWRHKAWVTCVLKHKDWHRDVMTPSAYTELFFLDEAVALAAGHRPCAMCRRADFDAYRAAAGITDPAPEMDRQLHEERAIPRRFEQRRHTADCRDLPNGAVYLAQRPMLIWGDAAYPIADDGYGHALPRPVGTVDVVTPPTSLAALKAGYRPVLHGLPD